MTTVACLMRRRMLFAAGLLLSGCASLPAPAARRTGGGDFAVDARFALRIERPGEAPQAVAGQLSWTRRGDTDRLLLQGPLGAGMAQIEAAPGRAVLRLASGGTREAFSPDALVREVTGYALPVERLAGWLRGEAGAAGRLERDRQGRPQRIIEDGWFIEYGYAGDGRDELPVRLNVQRDNDMTLRLRIDQWSSPDE